MCQCLPEQLEPPNEKIKRCRFLLQLLCASLILVITLAIIAQDILNILYYLLYAYLLYTGWALFNWCIVMIIFFFCCMQFVQVILMFAGMIQFHKLFAHHEVAVSIYLIALLFFYPTAIFITHYAYKHFKALSYEQMGVGGMNIFPPNNNNNNNINQEAMQEEPERNYMRAPEDTPTNNRNQANNNPFHGQGVRIG